MRTCVNLTVALPLPGRETILCNLVAGPTFRDVDFPQSLSTDSCTMSDSSALRPGQGHALSVVYPMDIDRASESRRRHVPSMLLFLTPVLAVGFVAAVLALRVAPDAGELAPAASLPAPPAEQRGPA